MKTTLLAILLLFTPSLSRAEEITATPKVAHAYGVIDDQSAAAFLKEMQETAAIDGERVIMIDSPGGSVTAGIDMIDAVEQEKATGVHVTCIVRHVAASMAFNLLTHCDTRIADQGAMLLFHKIEIGGRIPGIRMTAQNLRKIADELDDLDLRFSIPNAAALGFTPSQYNFYADHETIWDASVLKRLGYLDAIGNYNESDSN